MPSLQYSKEKKDKEQEQKDKAEEDRFVKAFAKLPAVRPDLLDFTFPPSCGDARRSVQATDRLAGRLTATSRDNQAV
jgi:hypothetical protein